eukprot:c3746_g1_i2.p1 GENE.c3746_g1_i2~~c3746_g1_i2.p1  ORF type:complete len:540 (+),score=136.49 c3746_g1_i2:1-1620(+)
MGALNMSDEQPANQASKAFDDKGEKGKNVRISNILAAKAISDAVRTSLGPRGMDKMIQCANGEVIISNDGATLLKQMAVTHPCAKMLVELSHAQDVEAGDGTTSVVVIAGSLLGACLNLLNRGVHPTRISEAFQKARDKADEVLRGMATPINLADRDSLVNSAITSLASKVISQNSSLLAPMAVDAVLKVIDAATASNVDLNDIKVLKKIGGTIDDSELVEGMVFTQGVAKAAGGPTSISNAKIALVQFCLSAPKTDIENEVVISDHQQLDRILKEEKKYIANLCKQIQKTGCNVLLVQKSILRDAISDLALHFLAKMKIMVIKNIEREDISFISRTLGCKPIASIDSFTEDKLGVAANVVEEGIAAQKIVRISGVPPQPHRTCTVLLRASNGMVLDEAERSFHDALCVVRSLVKRQFTIVGGAAAEIEVSLQLSAYSQTLAGSEAVCVKAFGEALEIIPYTLAENAGLHPMKTVTELRNKHAEGEKEAGINVRKGSVTNMREERVIQPLLVTSSALNLATETVRMILKIDDILLTSTR